MKGKNSEEFATGWSFISNRRMDLGLTSGIESTATVVVALFMVAGKKIKMAAARGSSVDEVLPVRGRTVARSHFWFCLRMRSGETSYHRELKVVAMVAGKELNLGGGGKGDGREPSARGRGVLLCEEGSGWGSRTGRRGMTEAMQRILIFLPCRRCVVTKK
jgi:hypothetical protein